MTDKTQRTTRIAILARAEKYGVIALDAGVRFGDGELRHVVGARAMNCSRPHFLKSFETPEEAVAHFNAAVARSVENGWTVAYSGRRFSGCSDL